MYKRMLSDLVYFVLVLLLGIGIGLFFGLLLWYSIVPGRM